MSGKCPFSFLSRRDFMKSMATTVGGVAGVLGAQSAVGAVTAKVVKAATGPGQMMTPEAGASTAKKSIAFFGQHQAGILTPQQSHSYFAAFDLVTKKREEVVKLLKEWTDASAKLTQGKPVKVTMNPEAEAPPKEDPAASNEMPIKKQALPDSGEVASLSPSRLTLTFGFGAGLFTAKDGSDRYGLKKHRPEALVEMPKFHGDELEEAKTGGDLSVQACSDDPQVAFHAIRQLARIADGVAQIRWVQSGFLSGAGQSATPRNLMGFKDGSQQPEPSQYDSFVWANEGPSWMHNGSFLVTRRIRIALEHWDRMDVDFQEQVIGRRKDDGAPLGGKREHEALNLTATDKDGNLIIPQNAHVRLSSAEANGGTRFLRRGYSYNDGVNFTAERWPPWRQGMEYDAGLFFVSYQNDPRTGFIKIFNNMAKLDALNQFVTHVGSGLFACPAGVKPGEYIGQKLFETT